MSRTIKVILAVIFVLLITFSAISIFQDLGKRLKVDVTDRKLYTGTRADQDHVLERREFPMRDAVHQRGRGHQGHGFGVRHRSRTASSIKASKSGLGMAPIFKIPRIAI